MKFKFLISSILIIAFTLFSCATSARADTNEGKTKTKTLVVRGNCEMCKNTIESAAKSVQGVQSADFDIENEILKVTFIPQTTSLEVIETAVAKAGYDTANQVGDAEAYENLPACCQYTDKNTQ